MNSASKWLKYNNRTGEYVHTEEANIDVKCSSGAKHVIDHLDLDKLLRNACFSGLTDAIIMGVVDDHLR